MKLNFKLTLNTFAALAFVVAISIAAIYSVQRMQSYMRQISEIEMSLQRASLEMEINANEMAKAVYSLVLNPNPTVLAKMNNDAQDFEHFSETFIEKTKHDDSTKLGNKAVTAYLEFKDLGSKIVSLADQRFENIAKLRNQISETSSLIEDEVEPKVNSDTNSLLLKSTAALYMETSIDDAFSAIQGYVLKLNPDPDLLHQLDQSKARFQNFKEQYKGTYLSLAEKKWLHDVDTRFQNSMILGATIIESTNIIEDKLSAFHRQLEILDEILDDEIQVHIQHDVEIAIDEFAEFGTRAITILILMGVGTIGFIALINGLIGLRIVRSIGLLSSAALEFGRGNLEHRIPTITKDEFGVLSETFNQMAEKQKYDAELLDESDKNLRRSQKMEAVWQLTGGIAHDFNNILGIVEGNLEILQRILKDDEKALGRVHTALKGTKRGADITKKLLGFARTDQSITQLVSVNETIQSIDYMLAKTLTAQIAIEYQLEDGLWPTLIDAGDLQDVILNLAINARDAMPDGGNLIIETSNKVLDKNYKKRTPYGQEGEFVMVTVSDSGVGMSDETSERAVEPFFTTKQAGDGTGLGLSMVYGFVTRSNGHLKIYSELGEGTTIRFYLPRAKGHMDEVVVEKEENLVTPRGNEKILIVDDEEYLVDVAATHLEDLGYQVLTANDGEQALQVLKENPDINLVFSDVIMPNNMDGYKLAAHAVEMLPDLRILLTSGFTKKRERVCNGGNGLRDELTTSLLHKPYNQFELATAIRNKLDT